MLSEKILLFLYEPQVKPLVWLQILKGLFYTTATTSGIQLPPFTSKAVWHVTEALSPRRKHWLYSHTCLLLYLCPLRKALNILLGVYIPLSFAGENWTFQQNIPNFIHNTFPQTIISMVFKTNLKRDKFWALTFHTQSIGRLGLWDLKYHIPIQNMYLLPKMESKPTYSIPVKKKMLTAKISKAVLRNGNYNLLCYFDKVHHWK